MHKTDMLRTIRQSLIKGVGGGAAKRGRRRGGGEEGGTRGDINSPSESHNRGGEGERQTREAEGGAGG